MPSAKLQDRHTLFREVKSQVLKKRDQEMYESSCQRVVASLVRTWYFDISMSILITFSMVLVIMDVNSSADGGQTPEWIVIANIVVLALYIVEVGMKAYAFRLRYLTDAIALFDVFVVTLDLAVTIIVSMAPVNIRFPIVMGRISRILKITRALRVMTAFPELRLLLKGLALASKTVFWGIVMLTLLLAFWGIFAVIFIRPLVRELDREGYWHESRCSSCPGAYASVQSSMMTLGEQLIVGEGWNQLNSPIMEKSPESAVFFVSVVVTMTLTALNLLMGTIVERAMEAGAESVQEKAFKKEQICKASSLRLYELCEELDEDKSGHLSFAELEHGFHNNMEFMSTLKAMDVDDRDLKIVFDMLDTDGNGDFDYQEFVEQLHMMKNQESQTLLVFIKFCILEIRRKLNELVPGSVGGPRPSFLMKALSRQTSPSVQPTVSPVVSQKLTNVAPQPSRAPEDFDELLQKLVDLKREVLDFSELHSVRTDHVQERIPQCVRSDLRPGEGDRIDGGPDKGARADFQAWDAELQEVADMKQAISAFSGIIAARLDDFHDRVNATPRGGPPEAPMWAVRALRTACDNELGRPQDAPAASSPREGLSPLVPAPQWLDGIRVI